MGRPRPIDSPPTHPAGSADSVDSVRSGYGRPRLALTHESASQPVTSADRFPVTTTIDPSPAAAQRPEPAAVMKTPNLSLAGTTPTTPTTGVQATNANTLRFPTT